MNGKFSSDMMEELRDVEKKMNQNIQYKEKLARDYEEAEMKLLE